MSTVRSRHVGPSAVPAARGPRRVGARAGLCRLHRVLAGADHHTVLSTATTLETWQDLAEIAQMELAVIDESTTARGFAQTLRLNQAYYRLTQA